MKKERDYFNLPYILSLVLTIIPITSWIMGAVLRLREQAPIAFVVRLLFGYVIWIIDILWMVLHRAVFRFLSVI